METCPICQALSSENRRLPGLTLYAGRYWVVEHAYPVKLTGWLTIVLKRHAEALPDLTDGEFEELAALQKLTGQALHETFGCAKEYGISLAETEGFRHLHYHVVAHAPDLPPALQGTRVFQMFRAGEGEALSPAAIQTFCQHLLPFFEN